MSAVIDKPRTALRSVRISRRILNSHMAAFHWYRAGKHAAWREYWMERAREGRDDMKPERVKNARHYHHKYMREIARAVELS